MGTALRTALQRQAALEQERRFLISAVAYDLRTPLFALHGYRTDARNGLRQRQVGAVYSAPAPHLRVLAVRQVTP